MPQAIYVCNDCGAEFNESMAETDLYGEMCCPTCGSDKIEFLYEIVGHPKDDRTFFHIMSYELHAFVHDLPPELNPEDADEPEYDEPHGFDHFADQGMEPTMNPDAICEDDDDGDDPDGDHEDAEDADGEF